MQTIRKPYDVNIRFDPQTGAFVAAQFVAMETILGDDGNALISRELPAIALDKAIAGEFGETITGVIGDFISALTAENAAHKAQNEELTINNESLQAQVEGLTRDKTDLTTQVNTLAAKLDSITMDRDALAAQAVDLNTQIATLRTQLAARNDA
jgi:cell division protein FtsB